MTRRGGAFRYSCCTGPSEGNRCVPTSGSCDSPPATGYGTCRTGYAFCADYGHRCLATDGSEVCEACPAHDDDYNNDMLGALDSATLGVAWTAVGIALTIASCCCVLIFLVIQCVV